jgi:mono/diheme cytochrome c family protein
LAARAFGRSATRKRAARALQSRRLARAVALPILLAGLALGAGLPARAADDAATRHGEVLFKAADCASCHTDVKGGGQPLAGGRPLTTPFGLFYGPNITPDKTYGIGGWSEAQFRRALREGIDDGGHYLFPVFPFASFTGMSDADIADLYAYLQSLPPVAQPNKPHEVQPPFGWRFLLVFWRMLFFTEGPLQPVAGEGSEWNRGRYLAEAVVHCEECHTPRNFLGALKRSQAFSGNPQGPDGMKVPNVTPDAETGIGKWSLEDITTLLKTGQTPDFDFVGSGMSDVEKGTAALSDADRHAIAVYLKSLPPIRTTKAAPEKKPES